MNYLQSQVQEHVLLVFSPQEEHLGLVSFLQQVQDCLHLQSMHLQVSLSAIFK